MLKWLDDERFKKLTTWAIYTMLFCQAFPLFYFNYGLDNPVTINFWTAGLLFPMFVALFGILKPELVAKALTNHNESIEKENRRGRIIASSTFLLFAGLIIFLRLF